MNGHVFACAPGIPNYFDVEKKIVPALAKRYVSIDNRYTIETLEKIWIERVKRKM